MIFSEQHKTLVSSCDVKCIESVVCGDQIKDYPKPLADILEIDQKLDQTKSPTDITSDVVALHRDEHLVHILNRSRIGKLCHHPIETCGNKRSGMNLNR